MCFDQTSAFSFAGLGLFLSWYVHHYTENTRLAIGVFWFFLMELLQVCLNYFRFARSPFLAALRAPLARVRVALAHA